MTTAIGNAFEQKLKKEIRVPAIYDWIAKHSNLAALTLPTLFTTVTAAPAHMTDAQIQENIAECVDTIRATPCLEIVFYYLPANDCQTLIHTIIELPITDGLQLLLVAPEKLSNSPARQFFISVHTAPDATKHAVMAWLERFSLEQRDQLLQGIPLFSLCITLWHSTLINRLLDFLKAVEPAILQSIFTKQALAKTSGLITFLQQRVSEDAIIIRILEIFIEGLSMDNVAKLIPIIEQSNNPTAWRLALQHPQSREFFKKHLHKRLDHPTAQKLLQGVCVLELIENPSLSIEPIQIYTKSHDTEETRSALRFPWLHQQTLLHIAVQKGHTAITAWLLEQGLDPNTPDVNQQSAWQIALHNNQKDILTLFVNDMRITLHNQDLQIPSPLQQCINQHDYPLTQAVCACVLKKIKEPDVIHAVSQTLMHYMPQKRTDRQIQAIQDMLFDAGSDTETPRNFRDYLIEYTQKEQDPCSCFLSMVATIHQEFPASDLEQTVYDFLRRQCEILANAPHDQNQRKTAQMVILFYLFALPHTFGQCIIHTLRGALTLEQQSHFDTLLCYALAQPRIYRTLDLTMHQHFHAQFSAKSPALKTLFEHYLLFSKLHWLPTALLHNIARTYNNTQLVNILNQRPTGIIAVLVDNTLDYQQPVATETLRTLQQTIESEIKLFHAAQPTKPLANLQIMLALAYTPSSKKRINAIIQSSGDTQSFLREHIHTILQSIPHDNTILMGSLLYDWTIASLKETLQTGYPKQAEQTCIRLFNQLNTHDAVQLMLSTNNQLTQLNTLWAKAIGCSSQANALIGAWFEQQCAQQTFVALADFLPQFGFLQTHLQATTIKKLCQSIEQHRENATNESTQYALMTVRFFLIVLENHNKQQCEQLGKMFSFLKKQTIALTVTDLSLWVHLFQNSLMNTRAPIAERRLALQLFIHILNEQTYDQHLQWLNTCSAAWQKELFAHAIAGLHDTHLDYAQACARLTQLYSQHFFFLAEPIQTIVQCYLGQQDLTFLSDKQLQHIAKQVLENTKAVDTATYHGVWIQRLLTSPRFIAACENTDIIDQLIMRYQRLSYLLKQDELIQLTRCILSMPHKTEHQLALQHLPDPRYAKPPFQAALLAKRDRLMQFVVKDAIRGLFNQLEDTCLATRLQGDAEDIATANQALHVFYTYQGKKIAALRSDFLFRIADRLYHYALAPQGDLSIANNPLLHWLNKYLPHRHFQIEELERRLEIKLYNQEGQAIGFIDDYNQALTFIDHVPTPLIHAPGITEGMMLYDSQQRKIGTLAGNSQVISDNLFRHATIAMIVGELPQNTLALSPAALTLLLTDVLHHNTLDLVYTCETMQNDPEKRYWFEQKLIQHLTQTKHTLSAAIIDSLIAHHGSAQLTHVLSHTKHTANRLTIFKRMLVHEHTRHDLFKTDFDTFINAAHIQAFLNIYLSFYKEPWFAQGLQCFIQCHRTTLSARLFQKSLFQYYMHLTQQGEKKAQTTMHALLGSFLSNDPIAQCLMTILAIDNHQDVQTLTTQHVFPLLHYFEKTQVVSALQLLNQAEKIDDLRHVYQLTLLILQQNFAQLFAHEDPRYAVDMAWQINELHILSIFLSRHQQANTPFDKKSELTHQLLDAILLRCANFGYGRFFYNPEKQFQENRALLAIQPPILRSNHQRLGSIQKPKKTSPDAQIWQALRAQQATIDWQAMLLNTWHAIDPAEQKSLPALTVFLIHYVGPSQQIQRLLEDALKNPQLLENKQALHSITNIMLRFPKRGISKLIFAAWIDCIQKNPHVLDSTIWQHLNTYYYQQHPAATDAPDLGKECALLQYFAQKKAYQVVQRAYIIQHRSPTTPEPTTRIWQKFFLASQIEARLQKHLRHWYFPLLAFFLRLRHQTFKLLQKNMQRCERPVMLPPQKLPNTIQTDVPGGAVIADEIRVHPLQQQLKKRYAVFLEKETKRKLQQATHFVATEQSTATEEPSLSHGQ